MSTIHIFVSYSHEDDLWVQEGKYNLIPWLAKALKKDNVVFWYDPKLRELPGEKFKEKIQSEIDRSDIAILLISQDFVMSEFIREVELPRIKERLEKDDMRIIPIKVGPVSWEGEDEYKWLTELQIIPGKPTPLVDYIEDNAKWQRVKVEEILMAVRKRVQEIRKKPVHSAKILDEGIPQKLSIESPRHKRPNVIKIPRNIREYFSKMMPLIMVLIAAGAIVAWFVIPRITHKPDPPKQIKVFITDPMDRIEVPSPIIVRGGVSDNKARVWVVVNPTETPHLYWVQPEAIRIGNSEWEVETTIGRPGEVDVGKVFKIMAIANPNSKLNEGDVLGTWPEAQWQSEIIMVTRR